MKEERAPRFDEEPPQGAHAAYPVFDPEEYLKHMDELEISEEQKVELLHTLWHIMAAFVDLGWGVNSIQKILPEFEQFVSSNEAGAIDSERKNTLENEFGAVTMQPQELGDQ